MDPSHAGASPDVSLTKKQRREQRRLLQRTDETATQSSRFWKRIGTGAVVAAFVVGGVYLAARAGGSRPAVLPGTLADPVTSSDWVRGNRDAPAVLVEYSDLQCPACANYYPLLKRLESEAGDRVAVVYRHFPLIGLHKNAELAARAAEAAGKQGKFWEMHDFLFERQRDWAEAADPRDTFISYAGMLSLDAQKFASDLDADDVKKAVNDDVRGGNRSRVNATPTFFLNGNKISNPRSYDELKAIVTR